MQANPPKVEFKATISKFRKRNKISSLLVYVLHKTRNLAFSGRSRAKTVKKCTKKCGARAKLFILLINLLFFTFIFFVFDVLVAVASLDLKDPI